MTMKLLLLTSIFFFSILTSFNSIHFHFIEFIFFTIFNSTQIYSFSLRIFYFQPSDSFRKVANSVDVKHDFRINAKLKDELKIRSATGTPKPATIDLNDIFISVKTTKSNHNTRLDLILNTWQQLAKEQVSFEWFNFIFFCNLQ